MKFDQKGKSKKKAKEKSETGIMGMKFMKNAEARKKEILKT